MTKDLRPLRIVCINWEFSLTFFLLTIAVATAISINGAHPVALFLFLIFFLLCAPNFLVIVLFRDEGMTVKRLLRPSFHLHPQQRIVLQFENTRTKQFGYAKEDSSMKRTFGRIIWALDPGSRMYHRLQLTLTMDDGQKIWMPCSPGSKKHHQLKAEVFSFCEKRNIAFEDGSASLVG